MNNRAIETEGHFSTNHSGLEFVWPWDLCVCVPMNNAT